MTRRWPLACGLLIWWACAPAASADDLAPPVDASASAIYTCVIGGAPAAETVGATLVLDNLPTSVKPGDGVVLRGRLSIEFSSAVALESQLGLATKVGLGATDFRLSARSDHLDAALALTVSPPDPVAIANPFELGADVAVERLTVPTDAQGEVIVRLPSVGTIDGTSSSAPDKVAFTSEILQDSLLQPSRQIECWLPAGRAATVVARIPVNQASKEEPGTDPAPPAPTALDTETADGSSSSVVPISVPRSSPPPSAADAPPEAVDVPTLASAAIPPATVRSGTFIPTWELGLFGTVICAAAVGMAFRERLRLATLKALVNRTPPPTGSGLRKRQRRNER